MFYVKLIRTFARTSAQNELAYRANFWLSLLHSLLNLGAGVAALAVLFGQVQAVNGWDLPATLALLGTYFVVGALRRLFIGPSLESLAGMDGEVWTGRLDYTLLRPVDIQFLASLRYWRPLALVDLVLGLAVLGLAAGRLAPGLTLGSLPAFVAALAAAVTTLYAILLAFAGLVFWSPGFLFTWIFDALFQMARYPVGLYPGWLRLVLTWIVPVGLITTVPAQALAGTLPPWMLPASLAVALALLAGASLLFRAGLRRYASASS